MAQSTCVTRKGGNLGANAQNQKPCFYLHVSKHSREVMRAGAKAEMVEDVFFHCSHVGIAKLYKVAVPKQERRQFREPASRGRQDHSGTLCQRGVWATAGRPILACRGSHPVSVPPPLLPLTRSSHPGLLWRMIRKNSEEHQKAQRSREFPGGPVVRIPRSNCQGHRFNPWSGN